MNLTPENIVERVEERLGGMLLRIQVPHAGEFINLWVPHEDWFIESSLIDNVFMPRRLSRKPIKL